MKACYITILLFLTLSFMSHAQTTLKGSITDSTENRPLHNAMASLLRQKDSVFYTFQRVKNNGQFEFANIPKGDYFLFISHPSYADFFEKIKVEDNLDMGTLYALSKTKLLEEIIVKSNRAMYLKGDTTVFTADSFKVAEGENVEALLKKLPGFQVDRNGKITAQGKTVERVLVDGEEFFGSDPGIATKNLRADIVKEVQLYEGKSDQAAFTGIDDGNSKQTINLKIKEDKKKGYFGKLEGGAGIREKSNENDNAGKSRYYGTAMFNSFKAKRKLSAYAMSSNTGYMNLDWDDANKFGGGDNMEMVGDAIFFSNRDWNSSNGIPINYNGGIHYSNKFNQEKNALNLGYKFNQIDAPGRTEIFARNFVADSSWTTNSINNFNNSTIKHNGNFTLESKLDSMNTLKITAGANFNTTKNRSDYYIENINDEGDFLNTNTRTSNAERDQSSYNTNVLWMHKFKKPFRTISVNANYNYNNSNADGYLNSTLDFYKNNVKDSTAIIDQRNISTSKNNSFGTRISYTEPLAKDVYLELSYAFNKNNRDNIRETYEKSAGAVYDKLIDSLSNNFAVNEISNTPGIGFRYADKKWNINLGTSVAFTSYEQLDKTQQIPYDYNFSNHNPRATASYKFTPNKSMRFNYTGRTQAPSLQQLQPIRVNTDPLNLYMGNTNLRPSFNHNFSMSYSSWKMLAQTSIYISGSYGFTHNAFVNSTSISNAIRTTQTVNADGNENGRLSIWYDKKIKSIELDIGFNPSVNYNKYVNFIADAAGVPQQNTTTNWAYNIGLSVGRDIDKKYSINIRPNAAYNIANATISKLSNMKYWTGGADIWGRIYLPKQFELSTSVDITLTERTSNFPNNNNFVFWNAELSKWIYKKEFQLKLTVNDILNQQNGYSRSFSGGESFTDTYNTILRRHFLIGFVWNFNKQNGSSNTGNK